MVGSGTWLLFHRVQRDARAGRKRNRAPRARRAAAARRRLARDDLFARPRRPDRNPAPRRGATLAGQDKRSRLPAPFVPPAGARSTNQAACCSRHRRTEKDTKEKTKIGRASCRERVEITEVAE